MKFEESASSEKNDESKKQPSLLKIFQINSFKMTDTVECDVLLVKIKIWR